MFRPQRWLVATLLLPSLALTAPGCDQPLTTRLTTAPRLPTGDFAGKMIVGPSRRVGRGHARTFVILGSDLRPASVGVFLTRGALHDLPATDTEFTLAFPIGRNVAPFDHATLDWHPGGHPPPGVYDVPHFDVHFYRIPLPERHAIPAGPESTTPPANRVPTGYVTTGESEAMMGVHYVDPASPEFQPGGSFTRTLIYGFHEGEMIFVEPMVATDYLRGAPNTTAVIAQPSVYPETGRYPLSYSVRYDAQRAGYLVSLDDLVFRTAP